MEKIEGEAYGQTEDTRCQSLQEKASVELAGGMQSKLDKTRGVISFSKIPLTGAGSGQRNAHDNYELTFFNWQRSTIA